MYFTLTLGCRVLHFAIKRAERKNVSEKLRCLGRTAKMFEKNKILNNRTLARVAQPAFQPAEFCDQAGGAQEWQRN